MCDIFYPKELTHFLRGFHGYWQIQNCLLDGIKFAVTRAGAGPEMPQTEERPAACARGLPGLAGGRPRRPAPTEQPAVLLGQRGTRGLAPAFSPLGAVAGRITAPSHLRPSLPNP